MVPDGRQWAGGSPAGGGRDEGDGASHRLNVSRPQATAPTEVPAAARTRHAQDLGNASTTFRRMGLMNVEFAAGVSSSSRVAR